VEPQIVVPSEMKTGEKQGFNGFWKETEDCSGKREFEDECRCPLEFKEEEQAGDKILKIGMIIKS
jgi:hypothetical protein